MGSANPCVDYGDAIGSGHKIFVRQVTPCQQSSACLTGEVGYICPPQVNGVVVVVERRPLPSQKMAEGTKFGQ